MARLAQEFCQASIGDWTGKAARMLAGHPELADYDLATAVVLGDAPKVGRAIAADPDLATRRDPATGWTALHAACASRWHQLDPARADGLLGVAAALLDAGADPNEHAAGGQWTPLLCAVAGAPNPAITRVLLERGAVPGDHDLYLAGFAADHECLRALLEHADTRAVARMALAAPISGNDTEGVRLLLEAGADPGQYHDDDNEPVPVVYAAVRAGCPAEIIGLLLAHGAGPAVRGPDGRSPLALATSAGRASLDGITLSPGDPKPPSPEVADLLRRHGVPDAPG
jgi:ankyrin repeat protein